MNNLAPFDNGPGMGCCTPNYDSTVDQLLGNAYQVVKFVAMRMPFIKTLSDNIANIIALADSLDELKDIEANMPALLALQAEMDKLTVLYNNLVSLVLVADNMNQVLTVHDNLLQIQTVVDNLAEIQTVVSNIAQVVAVGNNIAAVNGVYANMAAILNVNTNIAVVADVSTHMTDVRSVANNMAAVQNVHNNMAEILALFSDMAAITEVAGSLAAINAVNTNLPDINTVAGLGSDITTVAVNVTSVSNFSDVYQGAKAVNPTSRNNGTALQQGDLYFNTSDNQMRVYTGLSWIITGSTVEGVLKRPLGYTPIIATAGQTIVPVVGGYNAGNILVLLNGTSVSTPDVDTSSGTAIVFTAPLNSGDEVDYFAFGSFEVANTIPADGSVTDAKVDENAAISASKLSFVQAGTGAVARTVQDKAREVVSVKDFGAVGDGVADDTAAIQKAIATSKSVYFPSGTYLVSATITIPDRDTRLHGDGIGQTEVRFGTVATGFLGTFTSSICTFSAEGLLVTTTQSGTGVGLSLTWPEDFSFGFTARLLLERVTFRGVNDHTNGWAKCVALTQCDNASFLGCTFKGQGGDPMAFTQAANTVSAVGVELMGRYSPTDFHFSHCWFYCLQIGLNIGDTAEGVILNSCTMVEVKTGVSWATGLWSPSYPVNPGGNASGRPQLVVSGCRINCFQYAITTNGVVSIHVSDSLFYHIDRATQVGNLIQVVNSTECMIHDTELWSLNSAFKTNGIVFGSNVTKSTIRDCQFVSLTSGNMLSGVVLQTGANDNAITGLTVRGTLGGPLISDSGLRNAIGRRGVVAYAAANVSIPNNAGTTVPWSNVAYDTDGFWSGSGGTLTVPAGVTRVRVTANTVFDTNASGVRQLLIYKNGSLDYIGQGSLMLPAIAGFDMSMSCSTGVIPVGPGDTLQAVVFQNSGGPLNVQGTVTSLAVEVCD